MKKRFDRKSGLILHVILVLATIICVVFAACAKTPETPADTTTVTTDAPAVTDAPKATDAPTEVITKAPTEPPTEAPSVDPTEYPYEGMPEPYFDLAFDKNSAFDALYNNDIEIEDGEIGEFTVNLDGKEIKVTGFHGVDEDDYMTILLSEYESSFTSFVEEGVTYEIFIQIEEIPVSSGGLLISNGNGGGTNLAIRGSQGQINFNVGSTAQDGTYPGSGYIYAQTNDASQGAKIEAGKLVHVLGIYDAEAGKVKIYYNGELKSEGDFGSGEFNMASTRSGVLGIAYNASFATETLGRLTEFTVVKARVYRQALTDEQVRTVYENCLKYVTPAE
ncbi:MAG: hypothetical protein J5950_05650 [Clostridia bacterium]|nr:hypothetical protein [Clostridia bacterium]